MANEKTVTERSGVGFGVSRQAGPAVIEIRLHHDTIPVLKGVQIAFELLNGLSLDQAKKIADVLSENVVGIRVMTATEGKAEAASR
ncbi:MAG: hypothetical protein WBX02_15820 [Terriglobales bacterium]